MKKTNAWALLPIGIFVVLYLGLGILFEYILKISMGFYSIPIVVIFLVALLVACDDIAKVSIGFIHLFREKWVKNVTAQIQEG